MFFDLLPPRMGRIPYSNTPDILISLKKDEKPANVEKQNWKFMFNRCTHITHSLREMKIQKKKKISKKQKSFVGWYFFPNWNWQFDKIVFLHKKSSSQKNIYIFGFVVVATCCPHTNYSGTDSMLLFFYYINFFHISRVYGWECVCVCMCMERFTFSGCSLYGPDPTHDRGSDVEQGGCMYLSFVE